MRLPATIAALSLILTLGGPAFAQSSGTAAARLPDQSLRSSMLIGKTVVGDHGGDLCTIEDVLVRPGGGEPTVIVSLTKAGQPGRKLVALPLSKVTVQGERPKITGMTRQQLERMPEYAFPNYGSG